MARSRSLLIRQDSAYCDGVDCLFTDGIATELALAAAPDFPAHVNQQGLHLGYHGEPVGGPSASSTAGETINIAEARQLMARVYLDLSAEGVP